MARAMWQGAVVAQSDDVQIVEGHVYFPPESVSRSFLKKSPKHTPSDWKGEASYFDIVIDGKVNKDAAWAYEAPRQAASNIRGYVAFWKGVAVER